MKKLVVVIPICTPFGKTCKKDTECCEGLYNNLDAFPNLLYGQPGIPLTKSPDHKPELVIDDEKVFAPTKSKKRKAPTTPNVTTP